MTAVRTRRHLDSHTADAGGFTAHAVRLATVPLVEVRLRLPMPMPGPRGVAAAEVAAEVLFGHAAPARAESARRGGYLVAAADQDHLCVAATAPAAALAALLREIGSAIDRPAPGRDAVRAAIHDLSEAGRAGADDSDVVATATALRSAYGDASPYAYEWPGPELIGTLSPDEVLAGCSGITTAGGSIAIVGDVVPQDAVGLVEQFLGHLGRAPVPVPALPPAVTGSRNIAVHRPGAAQTTLRRVLVVPHDRRGTGRATDGAAWRVCDLVFGGQPSSRLARTLREDHGYAYIARSRLVRRPRATDLRIITDVGLSVTAEAVTLLDEVTRSMAEGVTDTERTVAGDFAAGAVVMSHGGQSDLAGLLSQELGLGRAAHAVDDDVSLLAGVTPCALDASARQLAAGHWHTVLVSDLDRIDGGTLPALGGAGWTVAAVES
ncbi:insulinase family protein [Streptomyces herbicida]|uniref:insulinase family protein n=1 Tax=Streptomyces herbicida TaxID=3065675 RepID=UPI002930FFF2|nr:insulinase family protein [Streptomyces sp. NEAU-HV9]